MCYSLSITPPTLDPGGRVRIALCHSGPPTASFRWDLHHEGRPTRCATYPCLPIALPLDTPGLHRFTASRGRRKTPLARGACLVLDDLSRGLDQLLRRPGGAGVAELQAHCVTFGVPPEDVHRRLDVCLSDFLRVAEPERRADLIGLLLQLSRPRLLAAAAHLGYARDGAVTPEDVVQAAHCRAVERIDGFLLDEKHRRFGPWITTITTHLGVDWYRHGKRERHHRRAPEGEPAIDPGQHHREEDLRLSRHRPHHPGRGDPRRGRAPTALRTPDRGSDLRGDRRRSRHQHQHRPSPVESPAEKAAASV